MNSYPIKDKASSIDILIEKAERYGRTTTELLKLQAVNKSADFVSMIATKLILVSTISIGCLFIFIGLAFFIGELTGKYSLGFCAMGLIYLLLALSIFYYRYENIKARIRNIIIGELLNENAL